MSYKHGRSAEYLDVSKPHFWNSGRGPYPSGAAHVSLTAVAEAHQTCGVETTPTAGGPRSVTRWRSRPADVRILRGNDLLDGAPTMRRRSELSPGMAGKVRRRDAGSFACDVIPSVPESPAQRRSSGDRNGGNRRRYGERPGQMGSSMVLICCRDVSTTHNRLRHSPEARSSPGNVPGNVPEEL